MVYTEEQRKHLAMNILYMIRENSMGRKKEIIGNVESVLTILVAPDSFLELQGNIGLKNFSLSKDDIWNIIKKDIKQMFPEQFTSEQLGE